MEKSIRVGVGLYIFNEHNQVLLGLRKSPHGFNTWCPPGGHMEFGETNEEAAIREAKEETNLTINANDVWLEGVTNDFFKETEKHYITLHLFCKKYKGEPKVMERNKCAEWKWFDINNLPENLMLSNKNFLKNHKLNRI
ncbi:NUDIX domain-containing protein [bacterium]|nr:NUDIX domain-containing protein [bacterium]